MEEKQEKEQILLEEEIPAAEENGAQNILKEEKPAVTGVRPAEGMPLPEKGFGSMSLWERAALFASDPEEYARARNVF